MTHPEVLLWQYLRQRPRGLKFRRQHPIGPYVVDFFCSQLRLAVEIDGMIHEDAAVASKDDRKDAFLKAGGLDVIHIAAADVLKDAGSVASSIAELASSPLHHRAAPDGPPPRKRGGTGD